MVKKCNICKREIKAGEKIFLVAMTVFVPFPYNNIMHKENICNNCISKGVDTNRYEVLPNGSY